MWEISHDFEIQNFPRELNPMRISPPHCTGFWQISERTPAWSTCPGLAQKCVQTLWQIKCPGGSPGGATGDRPTGPTTSSLSNASFPPHVRPFRPQEWSSCRVASPPKGLVAAGTLRCGLSPTPVNPPWGVFWCCWGPMINRAQNGPKGSGMDELAQIAFLRSCFGQ